MRIIKKNKKIVICEGEKIIEQYELSTEINFSKLIDYLLISNLTKKIDIKYDENDFDDNENNLIGIIQEIINDYNQKVEELASFKKKIEKQNTKDN